MENNSVRCPECLDLFVPEGYGVPMHFLDTYDGEPMCDGSGLLVAMF